MNSRQTGTRERATWKLVLGLGALALTVSAGCLVTEQFAFEAPNTPPIAYSVSPKTFSYVPFISDQRCPNATRFDAQIIERDPGQLVWVQLVINDQLTDQIRPLPGAVDSEMRVFEPMCAPNSSLTKSCNLVQILVSNDFDSVRRVPDPEAPNPEVRVLEWYVLGKTGEVPDAKPSDCVRVFARDAGTAPVTRDGGS